ncbi:PadR family transcriptional regulator [Kibdelosporangium aridum]|uniref:Transcriptional regulator PadR-like family protein n=1 Tax=Kibdelosporangium aridum TaxID=2030 RepID=A0A1W2FZL5_KIBAR|nr:Transcriptional regulator PadR-like family protein [Kibdelosporangium aridum]
MSRPERITEPFLDIVEVFWQSEEGVHGYELAKKTKRGRPTVYNNIDRLSSLGWIASRWEDPANVTGRPLRKIYHLTPEGQSLAEELLIKFGRIHHGDFGTATEGPGDDR